MLCVPLLHVLRDSFAVLLLVSCAGMVLLTGFTSVSAAVNAEVFPPRVRAAGIGFPYSLTVACSAARPPVRRHAVQGAGHSGLFPWYVAVLCLLSSLVYLRLPETVHRELER